MLSQMDMETKNRVHRYEGGKSKFFVESFSFILSPKKCGRQFFTVK